MEEKSRIILLTDAREMKKRQQKELDYYKARMKELQVKLDYLTRDIQITELAIKIIEKETTANSASIKT